MINAFLSALSFYTRIPVPRRIHFNEEDLNKGTRFLPLIGIIVGGFSAGILYLTHLVFSYPTAVVCSLIASVFLTGAFHEDGFSDTCDGLGGGWTIEEKLRIMKDSRVGAYGLIGTVLLFLLKFCLMVELGETRIIPALFIAASGSRLVPVYLISFLPYVRTDETSKAKPLAKKIGFFGTVLATITVAVTFFIVNPYFLILCAVLIILAGLFALFYKRKMGGYTGDMLGAGQQVSEVILYALLIISWKYFL